MNSGFLGHGLGLLRSCVITLPISHCQWALAVSSTVESNGLFNKGGVLVSNARERDILHLQLCDIMKVLKPHPWAHTYYHVSCYWSDSRDGVVRTF